MARGHRDHPCGDREQVLHPVVQFPQQQLAGFFGAFAFADVENVALTTGLKLSSSSSGKDRTDSSGAEEEEDDLNNNIHDDDENINNNKIVSAKKSNKMSMSDPSMVGLIVLAILVAAYLIRGVCRNFKGASSVVAPQKQA